MEERSWQDQLIGSSLHLENEICEFLNGEHYQVRNSIRYLNYGHRDFTEDTLPIYATRTYSESKGKPTLCGLNLLLLIQCIHRPYGTKWIFNKQYHVPGKISSPNIRVLSQFSDFEFQIKPLQDFDKSIPLCGESIEINTETELKNSISIKEQIQSTDSALLEIFTLQIKKNLDYLNRKYGGVATTIEDKEHRNYAVAFVPVLLTTADLFVLNPQINEEQIRKQKDMKKLGQEYKAISISKPNFSSLFLEIYSRNMERLISRDSTIQLSQLDQNRKRTRFDSPIPKSASEFYHSTISGEPSIQDYYFGKTLVCNIRSWNEIHSKIRLTIENLQATGKSTLK